MKLRELKIEDAEPMLEWMKDDSVVHDLQTDFLKMEISDCKNFIKQAKELYSQKKPRYLHYAITDEDSEDFDEYLGTVSLKNVDYNYRRAEFAITIRRKAMGLGLAGLAMKEIIRIGFECYNLNLIYWYVSPENKRANRFYEKNGYKGMNYEALLSNLEEEYGISRLDSKSERYIWYFIKRELSDRLKSITSANEAGDQK